MAVLSKQVRLLQNKWQADTGWPKRLEWLELEGVRGWTGQRIDFRFPIVAICGENGSGKSTILQAAASAYNDLRRDEITKEKRILFASDFFPDTHWDQVRNASIRVSVREGNSSSVTSVRKRSLRWRGNPARKARSVEYVDLSRIQPVFSRIGYLRMAKPSVAEVEAREFGPASVTRLSDIMGRQYANARMALTTADRMRRVPVLGYQGSTISGFHMGAGELTMAELLEVDPPKFSLVLIDEVETSLHPRAQRRLLRGLADLCRERELQVILTTHSPYILAELPPEARCYILRNGDEREVVLGVSPDFAMTKMDEEPHPECDLYVEDQRAENMLREMLATFGRDFVSRCQIVRYGAASVGQALGIMVQDKRFPRPSIVFVDGDQPRMVGCIQLPGGDAPERVVFEGLQEKKWANLHLRTGRDYSEVADALSRAMASANHHDWVGLAATRLVLGGDVLWTLMCHEWAGACLEKTDVASILDAITEALEYGNYVPPLPPAVRQARPEPPAPKPQPKKEDPDQVLLFDV